MTRPDAVLFDLGGTLCEHQPAAVARANLAAAAAQAGLSVSLDALLASFRDARRAVETEFLERPFYRHRELVATALRRCFDRLGAAPRESIVDGYCDAQRDAVVRDLVPRDDALATLARLAGAGLRLGLVSNIDDDYLEPILDRTGLRAPFEFVTSSEAAGACKPDPACFCVALDAMELAPGQCVYVGDSWHHDVIGARRAGMRPVWLTDDAAPSGSGDVDIVRRLDELPALLGHA